MQLKTYQENTVDELLGKAKKLLKYSGEKKLVFKSPTGSGKTIMMAEFLKRLADDRDVRESLSFIWTAPRQLHIQSSNKLERYFEDSRALRCSFFEDLDDRRIGENEVLFFNWESINKKDNVYIRDNEQDFNLTSVIERTKEEGREIILIIDEAHHHATSDISQRLIKDIGPNLTIEVSATPVIQNPDEIITVHLEDVKVEGMIKKAVILNDQFENLLKEGKIKSQLSGSSEELVIDAALKKRDKILKAYKKEKTDINPLILIQLPDRIGSLEDRMKEKVISILKDKYNISTEKGNNKLAIWLSGEHINKEDVERSDSDVEVLIFKQAIALGWDCPRAQILVLFRQWHSPIFSIQTVGRIMRMPEPDNGHYSTEILNYGYVYTNIDDIEIKEDIARNYITTFTSKRKTDYTPVDLPSCYSKRHRGKTRLTPLFIELFLMETGKYKLKKSIDLKSKKLDLKIISDWKAENIDVLIGKHVIGDKAITASSEDLQKLFDYFVRRYLSPFYPEDRSVGRVKESIYGFFEQELNMDYGDRGDEIIQIALSDKNIQHFINVIDITKQIYQKETVKKEAELSVIENWNVPESMLFGSDDLQEDRKKSIMVPFYIKGRWRTEKAFVELLENPSNSVKWWFKNGDRDATFFAVPYGNGEQKPFYVDFIIKLKDGRIGLFDSKAGFTQKLAGAKIDGLFNYIRSENKRGKNLFGGIVTNTDQRNYKGRWVYFNKTSKELKDNDFSNWKSLEV
ncbi:MAG: DEAD/DEAH box helicase family protein [Nitrospirae bacterium]|nr:DEAD/DEAH box helicase family protein [Nitrospirota bacterium]